MTEFGECPTCDFAYYSSRTAHTCAICVNGSMYRVAPLQELRRRSQHIARIREEYYNDISWAVGDKLNLITGEQFL